MSEDIFITAFENGKVAFVSSEDIFNCFRNYVVKKAENYIDISFGSQQFSTVYFDVDEEKSGGATINRPCGDPRLGYCMYGMMKLGNCVLLCPGIEEFVILNEKTLEHLPENLLDSFSGYIVVDDAKGLVKWLLDGNK